MVRRVVEVVRREGEGGAAGMGVRTGELDGLGRKESGAEGGVDGCGEGMVEPEVE